MLNICLLVYHQLDWKDEDKWRETGNGPLFNKWTPFVVRVYESIVGQSHQGLVAGVGFQLTISVTRCREYLASLGTYNIENLPNSIKFCLSRFNILPKYKINPFKSGQRPNFLPKSGHTYLDRWLVNELAAKCNPLKRPNIVKVNNHFLRLHHVKTLPLTKYF